MKLAVWTYPHVEFPEGEDSADHISERLKVLRDVGVELCFPFVADTAEHYFHSDVLGAPRRDLLGPFMEAARALEMTVHHVIGFGRPTNDPVGRYEPPLDKAAVPEELLSWACASWGENHERTVLLANELIERYTPQGLHLDSSRYPDAEVLAHSPCACARCREVRLRWLGKPVPEPYDLANPGIAYKELQMRVEFVRSYVESMRGLTDYHDITLSAAVRPNYYEDALPEGQDWAEWCADGLIDICCPMSRTTSFGTFAQWMAQHHRLTGDVEWLAGIGLDSNGETLSIKDMERQIRFAHAAGADGICIFHAGAIDDEVLGLLAQAREM